LVQQIAFHAEEEADEDGWVSVKQETLEWELALSPKAQRSARRIATDARVLEERRAKKGGDLEYRIDYANLEALVKKLPSGTLNRRSRSARSDSPNGHPHNKEEVEKDPSSSSNEASEGAQDAQAEVIPSGMYFVGQLMDKVAARREADLPVRTPSRDQRDIYGRHARDALKSGAASIDDLDVAFDRVVERSPERWIPLGWALDDARKGKVGTPDGTNGDGGWATPRAGVEAIKADPNLSVYVGALKTWDASQDEAPPVGSQAFRLLGGDDTERYRSSARIASVVRRATRGTQTPEAPAEALSEAQSARSEADRVPADFDEWLKASGNAVEDYDERGLGLLRNMHEGLLKRQSKGGEDE
jgi:hypothetical protein